MPDQRLAPVARPLLATLLLALVAALLPLAAAPATAAENPEAENTEQTWIVTLAEPEAAGELTASALSDAPEVDVLYRFEEVTDGFAVEATPEEAAALAEDPRVVAVEQAVPVYAASPQEGAPWGLDRIDQPSGTDDLYHYRTTAAGVRIYVVDSGVKPHKEFGSRLQTGTDFIDGGNGTNDCHGHGTHVAGTAAGTQTGVAKEATIIPVRVLNCEGKGNTALVASAIDWVLQREEGRSGRAVINLSLGAVTSSATPVIDAAVRSAVAAGIPVVVAAGNDNINACGVVPARVPEAITVGATAPDDYEAPFSNHGPCLDLYAPGQAIWGPRHDDAIKFRFMDGTSMAAPHVSGVAALHLAESPNATADEVALAITSAAVPAVRGRGSGSPNRLLQAPLGAPPGAPRGVTAVAGVGEATVSWKPPSDPGDSALTAYAVTASPGGSTVTVSASTTKATVKGLRAGTRYIFRVRAINAAGLGTASSPSPGVTPKPPPPNGPLPFDGDPATSKRIGGSPVEAAVNLSKHRFAGHSEALTSHARAQHVVLSRDDTFPDSLAGAPLTATGPLLFTGTNKLPSQTAAEIKRVLRPGGRIYLLGGAAAISDDVARQVSGLSSPKYEVRRLSGGSRIETALAIADEVRRIYPGSSEVLVARAYESPTDPTSGWADSVTGGAYGARRKVPIVLAHGDGSSPVHRALRAWLDSRRPQTRTVLGGNGAVSDAALKLMQPGVRRVSGKERTSTAAEIAKRLWGAKASGSRLFTVINGFDRNGWAYGLAAAGVAADWNAPLLLTTPIVDRIPKGVPVATAQLVSSCGSPSVDLLLVGTGGAFPDATQKELDRLDGKGC